MLIVFCICSCCSFFLQFIVFQMATIGGVEVRDILKVERVGVHSHIRGLGLSQNLDPSPVGDGMVGQLPARRAAGLIVKMIQVCTNSA